MINFFMQRWHRRWWRPDPIALAAFASLKPAVVITGASEGIGLAFAGVFVRAGRDVLMIARDGERLRAASASLRNPRGKIDTLALDITAPDALHQIDTALTSIGAYADILVNSAGIGLAGRFETPAASSIDALVALNVGALTALCRHVLPAQLVRGRGGIINLASVGGYMPGPEQAVYYASKAYVISLSEALAAETAGRGVHVMAVAPGPVETAFHAKMGSNTALYRFFLPALSADQVAVSGLRGFNFGLRVVVPGLLNKVIVLSLRVIPHRLITPLIAVLLRPAPADTAAHQARAIENPKPNRASTT